MEARNGGRGGVVGLRTQNIVRKPLDI